MVSAAANPFAWPSDSPSSSSPSRLKVAPWFKKSGKHSEFRETYANPQAQATTIPAKKRANIRRYLTGSNALR